eukprot:4526057-Alexandrium_andersonii.AAC.2
MAHPASLNCVKLLSTYPSRINCVWGVVPCNFKSLRIAPAALEIVYCPKQYPTIYAVLQLLSELLPCSHYRCDPA